MNYFRDNYTQLNTLRVMLVIFALIAVVAPIVTLLILQAAITILRWHPVLQTRKNCILPVQNQRRLPC